jgi:hypothetical protein
MVEKIVGPILEDVPEVGSTVYIRRMFYLESESGIKPQVTILPLTVLGVDRRNPKRLILLSESPHPEAYGTLSIPDYLDMSDPERGSKGIELYKQLTAKKGGRRYFSMMYFDCYGSARESVIDEQEGWE